MKIHRSGVILLLLATSCLSPIIWAQSPWSLGASVLVNPTPYRSTSSQVLPLPVIGYDSDRFFLQGLNAGAYIWKDAGNQLSLNAYYAPLHFRASDSGDDAMKMLNDRHATLMGGVGYRHQARWGLLRTELATDLLNNSNGVVSDVAYLYPLRQKRWVLLPGIGVTYGNSKTNNYYYGVSSSESRRSGLAADDVGASWSPYLELTVTDSLNAQWSAFITGRYTQLANNITDSPMVGKNGSGLLWTGIDYSF